MADPDGSRAGRGRTAHAGTRPFGLVHRHRQLHVASGLTCRDIRDAFRATRVYEGREDRLQVGCEGR